MKYNRAFWRALHGLTHPLSLAAIIILLFNDHWLRYNHPSWLTGKLGDFTWLLFAPFIAAVVFAWVVPSRIKHHEAIVAGLAFGFIGLWFALAKTIPAVHEMTTDTWEAIIGWQGTLRIDPTDLITLPALLLSWVIWRRANHQLNSLRPIAHVALALGVIATLASDSPNYSYENAGISTLCEQEGRLYTTVPGEVATYSNDTDEWIMYTWVYTSNDGGLTWDQRIHREANEIQVCPEATLPLVDPNNESIQYRWQAGEFIEQSTDGGATWTVVYDLKELSQDVRLHYNHRETEPHSFTTEYVVVRPTPLSGVIDGETGNAVFAMGWDGVLVRTPDGVWHWRTVGERYGLAYLNNPQKVVDILFFELWLAGALGFLIVTTSVAYMNWHGRVRRGWVAVGWVGWFSLTILFLPPYHSHGDLHIGLLALPLLVIVAIPLSAMAVWTLIDQSRTLVVKIAAISLISALLFLLPFIPWTQGTIPRYTTALVFALLLAVSSVASSGMYLRQVLPRRVQINHPASQAETDAEHS